jgi:hypothetical protein
MGLKGGTTRGTSDNGALLELGLRNCNFRGSSLRQEMEAPDAKTGLKLEHSCEVRGKRGPKHC